MPTPQRCSSAPTQSRPDCGDVRYNFCGQDCRVRMTPARGVFGGNLRRTHISTAGLQTGPRCRDSTDTQLAHGQREQRRSLHRHGGCEWAMTRS